MLRSKVLALTACGVFLAGGTAAHAITEDSPGWQCARMGDRFCGGPTHPTFNGDLVLVRGFPTPRHSLQLWIGRTFQVGRFATHCKPKHPTVVRVTVRNTAWAHVHACQHSYRVALS